MNDILWRYVIPIMSVALAFLVGVAVALEIDFDVRDVAYGVALFALIFVGYKIIEK